MWREFLQLGIGRKKIFLGPFVPAEDLQLFTDASSSNGFGILLGQRWTMGTWSELGISPSYRIISLLEFFPIVVAMSLFGESLRNARLVIRCDNEAVVHIINKRSSADLGISCLLRQFVLLCLQFNTRFLAVHVPGARNAAADALSRGKIALFRSLCPLASDAPVALPNSMWLSALLALLPA